MFYSSFLCFIGRFYILLVVLRFYWSFLCFIGRFNVLLVVLKFIGRFYVLLVVFMFYWSFWRFYWSFFPQAFFATIWAVGEWDGGQRVIGGERIGILDGELTQWNGCRSVGMGMSPGRAGHWGSRSGNRQSRE